MKRIFFALFFLFALLGACHADGMIMPMPDYRESVFLPEQKAVIIWDGSTEELMLESKITAENIASLAWVIPVESRTKPIVEAADEQVFFDLADLFRPKEKDLAMGIPFLIGAAYEAQEGVEVVEQLKVDIYDITILRATDETALVEWLNGNGYYFPQAFPNLLEDYVKSGNFYFIANKVNLQNKYPGISPSPQDFECAQALVSERWASQMFYGGTEDIIRNVNHLLDQYPECNGATTEPTAVLVSLRLGIATPLKITFTPSRPFYPMLLSSLNLGQGKAIVYFVSDKAYSDSTGLFGIKNMLRMNSDYLSEQGIKNGDTITLLTWEDDYSRLESDSFFLETAFDETLDPDFVPPLEIIFAALGTFLIIVIISLVLAVPFLAIPFLLGMAVAFVFAGKKKRKSFFAENNGLFAWIAAVFIVLAAPLFLILYDLLRFILMGLPRGLPSFDLGYFLLGLLVIALVLLPYYVSMALGFLFGRSDYKKRCYLFIAIGLWVAFVLLIWALSILPGFY